MRHVVSRTDELEKCLDAQLYELIHFFDHLLLEIAFFAFDAGG